MATATAYRPRLRVRSRETVEETLAAPSPLYNGLRVAAVREVTEETMRASSRGLALMSRPIQRTLTQGLRRACVLTAAVGAVETSGGEVLRREAGGPRDRAAVSASLAQEGGLPSALEEESAAMSAASEGSGGLVVFLSVAPRPFPIPSRAV